MADAAARVGDVARVAGDDVEAEVGHGLAGGGAVVETEFESVGLGSQLGGQVNVTFPELSRILPACEVRHSPAAIG